MKNIAFEIENGRLKILLDLDDRFGPSSTGKTTIVATTEGAVKAPHPFSHVSLNLTAWTKEKRS